MNRPTLEQRMMALEDALARFRDKSKSHAHANYHGTRVILAELLEQLRDRVEPSNLGPSEHVIPNPGRRVPLKGGE